MIASSSEHKFSTASTEQPSTLTAMGDNLVDCWPKYVVNLWAESDPSSVKTQSISGITGGCRFDEKMKFAS